MSARDKAAARWGVSSVEPAPKHDPATQSKAEALYADALTWGKPEGQDLSQMVVGTSWPRPGDPGYQPSNPGADVKRLRLGIWRWLGLRLVNPLPPSA